MREAMQCNAKKGFISKHYFNYTVHCIVTFNSVIVTYFINLEN